jgi:glycosyltransferase involved in cell wall biosynthesis
MTSPLVTVVMPTYNRRALLELSLASVSRQTWRDFEILVVDDGSTDGTEELLGNYNDARLRWLRTEKRCGAAVARNIGIAESRGEFVAFQDSDAEWEKEKLEVQMRHLLSSDAPDAVTSAFWREKRGSRVRIPKRTTLATGDPVDYKFLLWENFVDTPSIVARKSSLVSIQGFDEAMPRFQDWDLALRLSQQFRFIFLDSPLHVTRYQINSISSNHIAGCAALLRIMEKFNVEMAADASLLAHNCHKVGISMMRLNDRQGAMMYFRKAATAQPANIKYRLSLFLGMFGSSLYNLALGVLETAKDRE